MSTLVSTKRSIEHHAENDEPPLKRRKLNKIASNLIKSVKKPQWTPQSPSPSPPRILQRSEIEIEIEIEKCEIEIELFNNTDISTHHLSPSPPWGRSPSPPPSAYFHKPTKKKSRWDERRENATKPSKSNLNSLITAGVNSLIHSINLQQQKQQKIEPLLLDEHGNPLMTQTEEFFDQPIEPNHSENDNSDTDLDEFYDSDIIIKPATRLHRSHAFKFIKTAANTAKPHKFHDSDPCINHLDDTGLEWLDFIPTVEWWDKPLLTAADYSSPHKREMITSLIENPLILRPELLTHTETDSNSTYILTKKERKKMRRILKKQQHELRTDEIRLGLREAPEPRLKLSNIIRVLGAAAIRDPTAAESIVRAQMWKRRAKHELHNASKQLGAVERREKKRRKLQEDTSKEVHVGVFVVSGGLAVLNKTKVRLNAQQRNLTGALVTVCDEDGVKQEGGGKGRGLHMVVVEGGPKGIGKFTHLVMNRIKWEEDESGDGKVAKCKCEKVWLGTVAKRSFQVFYQKNFSEIGLKKFLGVHGVTSYWDMVKNLVDVTSNV